MRQSYLRTATLVFFVTVSVSACITPPREGPVSNSDQPDASTPSDANLPHTADTPNDDARSEPDRSGEDRDSTRPEPDDGPVEGPFRSCKELYDLGERDSGVYSARNADDDRIDVFCEMTIDGGGWTLVGRSAEDAGGAMGWTVDYGEVDDPTRHYSLAAKTHGIEAKEFLATDLEPWDSNSGLTPGPQRHRGWLPENLFESGCTQAACATSGVTYLAGECVPADHATMLDLTGFANSTERFFFRDNLEFSGYGLQPGGWSTVADCDAGGGLHQRQGLLFVR